MPTLQTVLIPVLAYVPDQGGGGGGQPPGIWGGGNVPMPNPPIHLGPGGDIGGPPVIGGGPIYPPGIWGPTDPRPGWGLPGQPPGIWGPTDPRPGWGLPQPPTGGGSPPGIWGPTDPRPGWGLPQPEPPLGIWGPNDPRPGWGLPGAGGRPEHPIYNPPGIWGPNDPRPGWGLPGQPPGTWGGGNVPMPSPPIHLGPGGEVGGPPGIWGPNDPRPGWGLPGDQPGIWGGANQPFPGYGLPDPGNPPPVFNPDDVPDHPEVPDLNAGSWMWIVKEQDDKKQPGYVAAFVPWPLAVTHPDYNPQYPPDDLQPGEWVLIVIQGRAVNAWIPTTKGHSEAPAPKAASKS